MTTKDWLREGLKALFSAPRGGELHVWLSTRVMERLGELPGATKSDRVEPLRRALALYDTVCAYRHGRVVKVVFVDEAGKEERCDVPQELFQ